MLCSRTMNRFLFSIVCFVSVLGTSDRGNEIAPRPGPPAGQPLLDLKHEVANAGEQVYNIIDEHQYVWYLKPNTFYRHRGIIYETNSLGLRDVEFPVAKPAGALRIVCLGDSVTFGAGIPFEETFEQQLERKLKTQQLAVKVINAGVGSQRAWQGLARLDKDVVRFRPDMVAICFGLNDGSLGSRTFRQQWKAKLQPGVAPPPAPPMGAPPGPATADQDASMVPNVPIDEYTEHLRALVTEVRQRTGARIYLLVFSVDRKRLLSFNVDRRGPQAAASGLRGIPKTGVCGRQGNGSQGRGCVPALRRVPGVSLCSRWDSSQSDGTPLLC